MKRLSAGERIGVVAIVLIAWALRWVLLMDAPPGWRDDDLIELYTFSRRIVEEGPELYFAGASGHEPLYHTLRAPIVALAGINQASARWTSAAAGTLVTLLTWAAGRRLFGARTGLASAALVSVSFWSLMYSRVAVRHIGVVPWMLMAIYWGWRLLKDATWSRRAVLGVAVGTAGALLTYYAGRLTPILLVAAYPLAASHKGRWRPYLAAVAIGVALAAPMFWTAAHLPGADARVSELAVPIHALRAGDPGPLLQTAWTTLGMAHARGDPEWLYNDSERPVFGPFAAVLFYASIALCLIRWRRPESRLLLLWLGVGIGPALISLPPSSYGHTILALPAVYLSLASLIGGFRPRWLRKSSQRLSMWTASIVAVVIVGLVAVRDIPDYFAHWSEASMVGFLYRADYRALAFHLKDHDEIQDLVAGSMLYGPWDKVAVQTDLQSESARIRWVDPRRAVVFVNGEATRHYLQDEGLPESYFGELLSESETIEAPEGMLGFQVAPVDPAHNAVRVTVEGTDLAEQPFAGAIALQALTQRPSPRSDSTLLVTMWWTVTGELPLPEETLIPNPPPPDVYNGPRLSIFAHLRAGDEIVGIDDGLWVDPYTLVPGDVIVQTHVFQVPTDRTGDYMLDVGLYDPLTGARWTMDQGADSLTVTLTP